MLSLSEISLKVGIKVDDLREVIFYIQKSAPTTSEIISRTNLSHSQVKRLAQLLEEFLVSSSGRWVVKDEINKVLSSKGAIRATSIDYRGLRRLLVSAKKLLPDSKRSFDQFGSTADTVVRRVKKLVEEKDIQGRRVVFLGDYDLTSVGCGYIGLSDELFVLDIDTDVLNTIDRISKSNKLGVKVRMWDLRMGIPRDLVYKFNTSFSDPPYTVSGFDLFLRRSLEATENSMVSSHYMCYGTSLLSRERALEIQRVINSYNLFIREKLYKFNKYVAGAEAIGSASDLYILEKTARTKLGKSRKIKKIYTWE